MGGSGSRLGSEIPKQFIPVEDTPLFLPIVQAYDTMPEIHKIIIVSHATWVDKVAHWTSSIKKITDIIPGGNSRSESVKNGLLAASKISNAEDIILFHDASHPYIDREGTQKVIKEATKYGAATLANFNYDTVYKINAAGMVAEVLPRTQVVNGASPEAFQLGLILPLYQHATPDELEKMTSVGALALSKNIPMKFVQTDILNLKITYQRDLNLYKKLSPSYFY